jgi:hypothetical protein
MGRIKIPDFPYAEAGFSFYKKALTRSNAVNPARTKPSSVMVGVVEQTIEI